MAYVYSRTTKLGRVTRPNRNAELTPTQTCALSRNSVELRHVPLIADAPVLMTIMEMVMRKRVLLHIACDCLHLFPAVPPEMSDSGRVRLPGGVVGLSLGWISMQIPDITKLERLLSYPSHFGWIV